MDIPKRTDPTPDEIKKVVRIAVELTPGQRQKELTGLDFLGKAGATLRLFALVEGLDDKKIGELIERARKLNPKLDPKTLPDFSSWYQVITQPGDDPDKVVAGLRKLSNVKTAYAMRPVPPPAPADNPRNANQGYQDPAPVGIDARSAWGIKGGDGEGIGFVDMERGWNLNHQDLPPGITIIKGDNYDQCAHGTSVLGVVLMVDNQVGGMGIAPAASGRVVSQWQPSLNNPTAIFEAIYAMDPGDVLLLEAQEFDPDRPHSYWPNNLWPVEIAPATYKALLWAKALGIVVVEAAADGGNDLDQYTNGAGESIFDPAFRDSGAIIVGAGTSAAPHGPVNTNTGQRIDCYAWGEDIDTTTTNANGTDDTAYRPDLSKQILGFGGTSGAAAIVAGAALIVQGWAEASGRGSFSPRFSPQELREILKTNGTLSINSTPQNPNADGIGVMPDLGKIIGDPAQVLARAQVPAPAEVPVPA